jgi:hypothetical protein
MVAGERVARISHMRPFISRLALAIAAAALLLPATASAVSVEEIVALAKAGVTDTVILALIDRDKTIFSLEPDQLVSLKAQGLSEPVIVAMLKSGRDEGDRAAQAESDLKTQMYLAERSSGPEVMVPDRGPESTPSYGFYPGAASTYAVPMPYAAGYGYGYGYGYGSARRGRARPIVAPRIAPSGSGFVAPANIPVVPPSGAPVVPPVSWPRVHSQNQLAAPMPAAASAPPLMCRAEIRGVNSAFPLTTIVACPPAMQPGRR